MRKQQHSTNPVTINRDHAVMAMYSRKGECVETIIDLEDVERILAHGLWRPGYAANAKTYYPRCKGATLLHRFILSCPKGLVVDHANGNTLDNRKQNLRIATHQQNMQNITPLTNSQSGFRNVRRASDATLWHYVVKMNGKRYRGYGFASPKDAFDAAQVVRQQLGMWDRA